MALTIGQSISAITLPWSPAIPEHLTGLVTVEARAIVAGSPHVISVPVAQGWTWNEGFWEQYEWAEATEIVAPPYTINLLLTRNEVDVILINNQINVLLNKHKNRIKF